MECNVLRRSSTHLNKLGADGFQHITRQPNSAVWSSELTLHISETVTTTPGHHVGLAKWKVTWNSTGHHDNSGGSGWSRGTRLGIMTTVTVVEGHVELDWAS
ncbi:hypothetical protein LSAT2_031084 [Lamellibrachia satsuma]|nr:hypothetical protein LSAT2_031084 [Lamellibrachia satsuma]